MAKMIITVGCPGAGKGYTINRLHPDMKIVDCDAFKEAHPDYDPKNPGPLHAWSLKEAHKAAMTAIGAGEDFIYDGTGSDVEKRINYINQARLAGYEVEILYVKVALNTAIKRNAARARTVDESIVRDKFSTIAIAFDVLSGYADKVTIVNND